MINENMLYRVSIASSICITLITTGCRETGHPVICSALARKSVLADRCVFHLIGIKSPPETLPKQF